MYLSTLRSGLTQKRLKEVLRYNPKAGIFTYKISTAKSIKVCDIAGANLNSPSSYVRISIDGVRYSAHRLAFLYMTGKWPIGDVDHIHGSRQDNRWAKIRSATRAMNSQNRRKAQSDSSTGLLGAHRHVSGKFVSSIDVEGKRIYLGIYSSAKQAHTAYLSAKRKLHAGNTL